MPYPSNIYIHHMFAYIYTSTFYVNKKTMQLILVSTFLVAFLPERFCIIIRVGEATISERAS